MSARTRKLLLTPLRYENYSAYEFLIIDWHIEYQDRLLRRAQAFELLNRQSTSWEQFSVAIFRDRPILFAFACTENESDEESWVDQKERDYDKSCEFRNTFGPGQHVILVAEELWAIKQPELASIAERRFYPIAAQVLEFSPVGPYEAVDAPILDSLGYYRWRVWLGKNDANGDDAGVVTRWFGVKELAGVTPHGKLGGQSHGIKVVEESRQLDRKRSKR